MPCLGLSPRVRGNHEAWASGTAYERSIPACAGEPAFWPLMRITSRVYPRVCGGTVVWRTTAARQAGLSPRVRGNPAGTYWLQIDYGSIPACAGEPRVVHSSGRVPGVYPRVCGGTPRSFTRRART